MTDDPRTRELRQRVEDAHERRARALSAILYRLDELSPLLDEAVSADRAERAGLHQLGIQPAYPDVRDTITQRLYVRCAPLRPFVPFVTDPDKE